MKTRVLLAILCVTAAPAMAGEKLSPEFRAAFERTFRTGRTFAVVVQPGVPTTSVYGKDGKSASTAHYSVDVIDGRWKTSAGLLDFDQTAADFLGKGETDVILLDLGLPDMDGLPRSEVVVSRAVADPVVWVPLGSAYLAPGGTLLAMLGKGFEEERLAAIGAGAGLELMGVERYELPFSRSARAVARWVARRS